MNQRSFCILFMLKYCVVLFSGKFMLSAIFFCCHLCFPKEVINEFKENRVSFLVYSFVSLKQNKTLFLCYIFIPCTQPGLDDFLIPCKTNDESGR